MAFHDLRTQRRCIGPHMGHPRVQICLVLVRPVTVGEWVLKQVIQEYQTGTHKWIPEFGKAHDPRLLWQAVSPRRGTINTELAGTP